MLRISDFLLLTMQTEMFFVIYVVLGLSLLFLLLLPFVKFVIALEWSVFLTYIIAVILMFWFMSTMIHVEEWQYVLYAIVVFSILLSIKRGIQLRRNKYKA